MKAITFCIGQTTTAPRGIFAKCEATLDDNGSEVTLIRERLDIASGGARARFVRHAAELAAAHYRLTFRGTPNATFRENVARMKDASLLAFEDAYLTHAERDDREVELVPVADVEYSPEPATHDLFGLAVPLSAPSVFFGASGAFKSTTAMRAAVGIAQAGRRVLLLDLENDTDDSQRALAGICAGLGVEVPGNLYRVKVRQYGLDARLDALRRQIRQHRIDYAVIDSASIAAPGDLSDATVAKAYFHSLAGLGVRGSLTIAHEPKAATEGRVTASPLGSMVWQAIPRLVVRFEPFLPEGAVLAVAGGVKHVRMVVAVSNTAMQPGAVVHLSVHHAPGRIVVRTTDRRAPRPPTDDDRLGVLKAALAERGALKSGDLKPLIRKAEADKAGVLRLLADDPDVAVEKRGNARVYCLKAAN